MRKISILLLTMVLVSCALKLERENPLDPGNSGLEAPNKVIVFQWEPPYVSIGSVVLEWTSQDDAAEYRIYRSLSYDGNYSRIPVENYEEVHITGDSYEDLGIELISETWYYYKISAVNSNGLEGYRSDPIYTYFIDESSK